MWGFHKSGHILMWQSEIIGGDRQCDNGKRVTNLHMVDYIDKQGWIKVSSMLPTLWQWILCMKMRSALA